MQRTNRAHLSPILLLLAALLTFLAVPTFAAEATTDTVVLAVETSVGEAPISTEAGDADVATLELQLAAADWGGPDAPVMTAIRGGQESGSDCTSSPGSCSGPGSCRSYCLALTGEIGFCHVIYNCCVCLAY